MSLGIFPIIIFLVVAVLPPIIATLWEKGKDGQLARKPYLMRAIGILILVLIVGFLLGLVAPEAEANVLLMLFFIPIAIVGYIWQIRRLRNIGWSTHLIWVNLIPIGNVIFSIVLLVKAPKFTAENEAVLEIA